MISEKNAQVRFYAVCAVPCAGVDGCSCMGYSIAGVRNIPGPKRIKCTQYLHVHRASVLCNEGNVNPNAFLRFTFTPHALVFDGDWC